MAKRKETPEERKKRIAAILARGNKNPQSDAPIVSEDVGFTPSESPLLNDAGIKQSYTPPPQANGALAGAMNNATNPDNANIPYAGTPKTADILLREAPQIDKNASQQDQLAQGQERKQWILDQAEDPSSKLGKNNDKGWKGRLWDIARESIIGMGQTADQQARSGQEYDVGGILGGGIAGGLVGGFDPSIDERRAVMREADAIDNDIAGIRQQQQAEMEMNNKRLANEKVRQDVIAKQLANTIGMATADAEILSKDLNFIAAMQSKQFTPGFAKYVKNKYGMEITPAIWQKIIEKQIGQDTYARLENSPNYTKNTSLPPDLPNAFIGVVGDDGKPLYTTNKDALENRTKREVGNVERDLKVKQLNLASENKDKEEKIAAENRAAEERIATNQTKEQIKIEADEKLNLSLKKGERLSELDERITKERNKGADADDDKLEKLQDERTKLVDEIDKLKLEAGTGYKKYSTVQANPARKTVTRSKIGDEQKVSRSELTRKAKERGLSPQQTRALLRDARKKGKLR